MDNWPLIDFVFRALVNCLSFRWEIDFGLRLKIPGENFHRIFCSIFEIIFFRSVRWFTRIVTIWKFIECIIRIVWQSKLDRPGRQLWALFWFKKKNFNAISFSLFSLDSDWRRFYSWNCVCLADGSGQTMDQRLLKYSFSLIFLVRTQRFDWSRCYDRLWSSCKGINYPWQLRFIGQLFIVINVVIE